MRKSIKNNRRKICFITGTRAEYGLLRNIMLEMQQSEAVELQIIVTGSHLVKAHGETVTEIKSDGFEPNEEVDMLLASDSRRATGQSMGLATIGLTSALSRLQPEIIVLLGDRYEALAAAQSAMILRIPIAHIHGGEATEGLIDEAIRHCITKMSHLHFTAASVFRNRVIQLGENPANTFNVGAVALDNIAKLVPTSTEALESILGIRLNTSIFLVTYHPVTLCNEDDKSISNLLEALSRFPNASLVFTGANSDALGQTISEKMQNFCALRPHNSVYVSSLGFQNYLSLMRISEVVIGNSSSGLLEAPAVGVPTVNIGMRQRGRLRAPSVIDCGEETDGIEFAVSKACSPKMKKISANKSTPYGSVGAAKRIAKVLIEADLNRILLKRFYDK